MTTPSEVFCLITTLLDPVQSPAGELAELYAALWTSETIYKNIKVEQRGGRTATLRSNSPALVEQELWAMLCVYQALRHLTADTADQAGLPVTHISFKNTLAAVRRTVGTAFPPRKLAAKLADVQADLIRTAVKPRPGRAAPRATKRSGTGYRTLRPDEPATTQVTHTINLQLFTEELRPTTPPGAATIPPFEQSDTASAAHAPLDQAA